MVICDIEGEVTSMAIDDVNGFVYWGDVTYTLSNTKYVIKRATLKGDDITVIIDAGK